MIRCNKLLFVTVLPVPKARPAPAITGVHFIPAVCMYVFNIVSLNDDAKKPITLNNTIILHGVLLCAFSDFDLLSPIESLKNLTKAGPAKKGNLQTMPAISGPTDYLTTGINHVKPTRIAYKYRTVFYTIGKKKFIDHTYNHILAANKKVFFIHSFDKESIIH